MAWLFLDTHVSGGAQVAWLEKDRVQIFPVAGRANKVLNALSEIIGTRVSEIEGIAVVEGPGSFSSIRTGVLYANLFSRLLKKPLIRFSVHEGKTLEQIRDEVFAGSREAASYVAPIYDQEPNITLPKRAA